MLFERTVVLDKLKSSAFLFGPRLTGKTTLLRNISSDAYFDLLNPELELEYKAQPGRFWEQISALGKGSLIIIDEVQKVPHLLNYVQMGIDQYQHRFILSGSSARKLRRGGANLLGGRALDLKLHPLTNSELSGIFKIDSAIEYGTIPIISSLLAEGDLELAKNHLRSYVSTYLKEEIQAEALTRNLGAFNRFLNVAAQSNAQVIEFANISRECSVAVSTVKEYYQILEDTLIGHFLWPFDRSERKKKRPKFYFFDCGVIRAMQNRLNDPPTSSESGYLFETWFINELITLKDYYHKDHEFSFWRKGSHEIDLLIYRGEVPFLAIEFKTGNINISNAAVRNFRQAFPETRLVIASLMDKQPRRVNGVDILPWKDVLDYYINSPNT